MSKILHAQNDVAGSFVTVTTLVYNTGHRHSALGSATPDQPTVMNVSAEYI
jgi:hypothetical protein